MSLFGRSVQVSQVQAVMMTVVIPQLYLVEKIAVIPDVRMVLVTQTSESLGTARRGVRLDFWRVRHRRRSPPLRH